MALAYTFGCFENIEKKLYIEGDVGKNVQVKAWSDWDKKESINNNGIKFQTIQLASVLKDADILGDLKSVYFVAHDGFTSVMDAADISECYLTYDKETGWSVVTPKHPISTNAKDLEKIILISDGDDCKILTIVDKDGDSHSFSPGQILTGPITAYPDFEGSAVTESDGMEYSSLIYTKSYGFSLSDLVPIDSTDYLLLKTKANTEHFLPDTGHFTINDLTINYVDEKGEVYEQVLQVEVHPFIALEE